MAPSEPGTESARTAPGSGIALGMRCGTLVALAAAFAFWPVVNDEFVFDDVTQAKEIAPAAGLADWLQSVAEPWWPESRGKNLWRPTTRLLIVAERSLAGSGDEAPSARPFHLTSLLLHIAAAIALLALARAIGLGWAGATVAGLAGGIHPVFSESVHQIVGQAELLVALFVTLGLASYISMRRAGVRWPWIGAVQILLYAAALGSKEHAAIYPLFLILVELSWARARQLRRAHGNAGGISRSLALGIGAGLAVVLIVFLLGRVVVTGGLIEDPATVESHENILSRMGFIERQGAALGIFGYACSKALLPVALAPDYSAGSLPLAAGWAWPMSSVGFISLALLIVFAWRDFRRGGRGWAVVIGGLAAYGLTSNAAFTIGVAMAERLWRLPLFAAALGVGWFWERWWVLSSGLARDIAGDPARARPRLLALAPLYALIIACGLLLSATWNYAPVWRTERSFAEATLERFPDSWRANHNLAREYYRAGEFEAGLERARRATALRSGSARSWDFRGLNAMFVRGAEKEARRSFGQAIATDPELQLAYKHLGNALMNAARPKDALYYYERYLEFDPGDRESIEDRVAMIRGTGGGEEDEEF